MNIIQVDGSKVTIENVDMNFLGRVYKLLSQSTDRTIVEFCDELQGLSIAWENWGSEEE